MRGSRVVGGVCQRAPCKSRSIAIVFCRHYRQRIAELLRRPKPRTCRQYEAPILRLAFVHPQQRVAHRHVEIWRPEIGGTPELAIPRMRVLVRQQVATRRIFAPCREVICALSVFAGLVVLGAVAGQHVGQRKQEIVMIVVMRAEQAHCLRDQGAMRLQLLRRYREILWRIGDDIQMHRNLAAGRQINALEILARVDRRIDQRVQCHRLESGGITRSRSHFKRGAELPAADHRHARHKGNVAGKIARRIQRHRAPIHVHHLVGDLEPAVARRQIIELRMQRENVLRQRRDETRTRCTCRASTRPAFRPRSV